MELHQSVFQDHQQDMNKSIFEEDHKITLQVHSWQVFYITIVHIWKASQPHHCTEWTAQWQTSMNKVNFI